MTDDKILPSDSALAFQVIRVCLWCLWAIACKLLFDFIQKQSPFLEDMNSFIHLAKVMGLINQRFYNFLPNATVCKGKKPHVNNDHVVIVKLGDIYGMLVLLALGIGVALTSFIAENGKLLRLSLSEPGHFNFLGPRLFQDNQGLHNEARIQKKAWK